MGRGATAYRFNNKKEQKHTIQQQKRTVAYRCDNKISIPNIQKQQDKQAKHTIRQQDKQSKHTVPSKHMSLCDLYMTLYDLI